MPMNDSDHSRPGSPPEDMLEAAFGAARRTPAEPDDALMARLVADAEAMAASRAPRSTPAQPGWLARALSGMRLLGGWPAMTGLAASAVVGMWLGANPPAPIERIALDWVPTGQSTAQSTGQSTAQDSVLIDLSADAATDLAFDPTGGDQ